MFNTIGWNQPMDDSDQWDGFNDPGIEHFRGYPIFHLAREATQNALDAPDNDLVKISFRFQDVETKNFPNLDQIKDIFSQCLKASKNEGERAETFFKNAVGILSKKRIGMLNISDSYTSGIKGPSENGKPFYAFIKATGQSKKASDTATGSYGIGKFAPYAVSGLRTIFLSTIYLGDDNKCHQLSQGKSILISHDNKGKRRRGVSFWGICEKCKPIEGSLPKPYQWIQRANKPEEYSDNKGTTIIIAGFEPLKNWREILAISVAENFFGAISNNKLEANIDDKIFLSYTSIEDFFNNQIMLNSIQDLNNEPDRFNNSKAYLEAIQDEDEVQVEETEHRDLGLCKLRILVKEGLPKKVCVLRNGMVITDKLNRLKSFPDFKEFVAVLECKSSKGNKLLRDMEPPRHDDFEPERLSDPKQQVIGRRALLDLAKWVREMLKRHAKDPVSDVTTLDELKDFFGDDLSDGDGKGINEVNPFGEVVIRARPLPKKTIYGTVGKQNNGLEEGGGFAPIGDEGYDGGGQSGGGSIPGVGPGDVEGHGGSGLGDKSYKGLCDIRAVVSTGNSRKISFTPTSSGLLRLRLMRAGADTDHDINIIECDKGQVKEGCVTMNVEANKRTTLNVKLGKSFDGSIKVLAYEI